VVTKNSQSKKSGMITQNSPKVLITGGAGFIGSHLADKLLRNGYQISVLDNLHHQIHGPEQKAPAYLDPCVEFRLGDVCDPKWQKWIAEHEIVYHFASHTGVGQSMQELVDYTNVNCSGLANVLESVIKVKNSKIKKVVLSSSRAVYGEGAYLCPNCGKKTGKPRSMQNLKQHIWDVFCDKCGAIMTPLPTDENTNTLPVSIYGLTKLYQEQLLTLTASNIGFDYQIFRFFNVFGPRQAPNNPYTGVLMHFIKLAKEKKQVKVFEDGQMLRDYVHVDDVVATITNIAYENPIPKIFNIATGKPITLLQISDWVTTKFHAPTPIITQEFRIGDIRHCYGNDNKMVDSKNDVEQKILDFISSDLT
jgi:dTDP-L-rhamnose 4-epimerase